MKVDETEERVVLKLVNDATALAIDGRNIFIAPEIFIMGLDILCKAEAAALIEGAECVI